MISTVLLLVLCAAATSALNSCSYKSCSECAGARGCGWNAKKSVCSINKLINPTLVTQLPTKTTFATINPTLITSIKPTLVTSINPTIKPTLNPTIKPTLNPTFVPTLNPTFKPKLKRDVEQLVSLPKFDLSKIQLVTTTTTAAPTIRTIIKTFSKIDPDLTFGTISKFTKPIPETTTSGTFSKLTKPILTTTTFGKLTKPIPETTTTSKNIILPTKITIPTGIDTIPDLVLSVLITDPSKCPNGAVGPTKGEPITTTTTTTANGEVGVLPTRDQEGDDDHPHGDHSDGDSEHKKSDSDDSDNSNDRVGDVSDLEGNDGANSRDDEETAGGDSTGLIIGAVVGGVLCLAGLALVVFAIVKRNNDAHYTPPSARSRPAATLPNAVYGATPRSGGSVDEVPRGYSGASNMESGVHPGSSIGSYGAYSEAGGEYKAIDLAKSDVNNFDNQGYDTQSSSGLPGLNTQSGNFF